MAGTFGTDQELARSCRSIPRDTDGAEGAGVAVGAEVGGVDTSVAVIGVEARKNDIRI